MTRVRARLQEAVKWDETLCQCFAWQLLYETSEAGGGIRQRNSRCWLALGPMCMEVAVVVAQSPTVK